MSTRNCSRFIAHIAIALAAVPLAVGAPSAIAAPNIVVLMSDDSGYADWGFMNQFTGQTTEFKTPNLDSLAQHSVVFSNAYVSSAACAPSRAGLLTGRYQERFGVEYNYADANSPNDGTPVSEVMIMEALKSTPLGYTTGVVGKWHQGLETAKQPQNQGVDEFYGFWGGSRPYFEPASFAQQQIRRGANIISWQNEASFNNIPADPILGRHVTDALGDEASKFIANHANETAPFFLYVPFNAAHSPYELAKQQDLAQFDSSTLTSKRKNVAALTYAMDRAIGNILSRIDDPDGNPNTSDSVANNTIVVFLNDNGGNTPLDPTTGGEMVHNNGPLKDYKGSGWEGGIRVPMIIRAPGVDPGVVNEAVSSLDLYSTFIKAAGATPAANLDGVDLMPHLTGGQSGAIHDQLFWRGGVNYLAMRQGNWKLVKGGVTAGIHLYQLNPDGSGETTFHDNTDPAVYKQMTHDFVDWEATIAKPTQTTLSTFSFNRFDAFRYRTDVSTTSNWRDASWLNDQTPGAGLSMTREDSYANAVLAFHPRNDASYTSVNNFSRAVGYAYSNIDAGFNSPDGFKEFMLNELHFDGQFAGAADRSATLQGFPLMFVKNLAGGGPKIALNSTASSANKFSFLVNMDVVLHDNLEITGNGTQALNIGGQIRDFDEVKSVTKTGTGSVIFSGNNVYGGETIVNQGTLRIEGANAALANTSKVQVGGQGTLAMASGRIHTPLLQINAGGAFNMTGGILEAAQVLGPLTNNGGTFRPGLSVGSVNISGNFSQAAGNLAMEIGGVAPGAQYDQVIANQVLLGGTLEVSLINAFTPALGDTFEMLKANAGISGTFSAISVPALPVGRKWAVAYNGNSVTLQIVTGLAADFDHNNVVNAADLSVWSSAPGGSAAGDADLDGDSDGADFMIWQRQQGLQLLPASGAMAMATPEGDALPMALMAALALVAGSRGRKA